MGFLKWLKRELAISNSCKRRQSELSISSNEEDSYARALSKFNEWRNRKLLRSTFRLCRKKGKKIIAAKKGQGCLAKKISNNFRKSMPNNSTIADNNLYEEIQVHRYGQLKQAETKLSKIPACGIKSTIPIRHSYPASIYGSIKQPPKATSSYKQQVYEKDIAEFESQFITQSTTFNNSNPCSSPPVKFYSQNSNPFPDIRSPRRKPPQHPPIYEEVENLIEFSNTLILDSSALYSSPLVKSSRRNSYPLSGDRAPLVTPTQHSPIYEEAENFLEHPNNRTLNNSEVYSSLSTKSYKQYSSPFRDNITPRRRATQQSPIYEEPENLITSSNTGTTPNIYSSPNNYDRTPRYQVIINKHGEEVVYALPLNEKSNENGCGSPSGSYVDYIDDNFNFLNRPHTDLMSTCGTEYQTSRTKVTDYNKLNGDKSTNKQEIPNLDELVTIELQDKDVIRGHQTNKNMFFAEVVVCNTTEIEEDGHLVFEALNGTLHSGTFHNVPVTLFKQPEKVTCDNNKCVLQRNYEILRKIRHTNIALLMGITVNTSHSIKSLILEPLDYTLNHLIHEKKCVIPLPICLQYIFQINNAVTYLHKHGFVHSNISTHGIMISESLKSVKLTSFELTTELHAMMEDELMSLLQNETKFIGTETQLPFQLRPYSLDYRKTFSKYNYQAPELLSTTRSFVFPDVRCDIYGIGLVLWEMINCSIPLRDLDYGEIMKLSEKPNAQLLTHCKERESPFQNVLESAVAISPKNRFPDTSHLNVALNKISIDDKPLDLFSTYDTEHRSFLNLLGPKLIGKMTFERTSTLKAKHNKAGIVNNHGDSKQLLPSAQNGGAHNFENTTSSPIKIPPYNSQYGFDIGEVSLPETPIARSNKLRKNAWLSNGTISPIVNEEYSIHNGKTSPRLEQEKKPLVPNEYFNNKRYKVNILIRPKARSNSDSLTNGTSYSPCENDIVETVETNSIPISDHIKFFNSVSQSNEKPSDFSQSKRSSTCNNFTSYHKSTTSLTDHNSIDHNLENHVSPVALNSFLNRSQHSSDFENSLWRREKQKCDQSINQHKRISVKEAIVKFESFSKSMLNVVNGTKPTESNRHSNTNSLECNHTDANEQNNISTLNVILKKTNNLNIACNSTPENKRNNNDFHSNLIGNDSEIEFTPTEFKGPKQNSVLTLNFKRLDRRSSDLSNYTVHQRHNTKPIQLRHSIYGTDIFKRLANTKNPNDSFHGSIQKARLRLSTDELSATNKGFKIKVGKLMCFNCGHKLFVVDDIVQSNGNEPCNETSEELLSRNSGIQEGKSTEDFYIDDDFCEELELCANMELGTQSHHTEFINFDMISADIFNPEEDQYL